MGPQPVLIPIPIPVEKPGYPPRFPPQGQGYPRNHGYPGYDRQYPYLAQVSTNEFSFPIALLACLLSVSGVTLAVVRFRLGTSTNTEPLLHSCGDFSGCV